MRSPCGEAACPALGTAELGARMAKVSFAFLVRALPRQEKGPLGTRCRAHLPHRPLQKRMPHISRVSRNQGSAFTSNEAGTESKRVSGIVIRWRWLLP